MYDVKDFLLLSLGALVIAAAGGVWDGAVAAVGVAVYFGWPRTSARGL